MSVAGIAGTCSQISQTAEITIKSMYDSFSFNTSCYITEKICSERIPIKFMSKNHFKIPNTLYLADPDFNISGPIDLILNASALGSKRIKLMNNIWLCETALGWIVGGEIYTSHLDQNSAVMCKQRFRNN